MRRRRRQSDNNLSFLDVVSCGFGAVVLLILIAKTTTGSPVEDFRQIIEALREQLTQSTENRAHWTAEKRTAQERLETERQKLEVARQRLASAVRVQAEAKADAQAQTMIEAKLKAALQDLNEEMRRLDLKASAPDVIGGIPADSEYIIFIIDTSGSMKNFAWAAAEREMVTLLDAYPKIKGMQVLNDMGSYMFSGYRRRWIPDTPSRRKIVLKRFRNWNSYSNSSPVEGIVAAIKTFRTHSDKISLYIFGDEYTGKSIQAVVDEVRRLNYVNGERQVRIHAIGFFTRRHLEQIDPGYADTTGRFAALMRELTHHNGGTFLGVNVD